MATAAYQIGMANAQVILRPRMPDLTVALRRSVHEWNTGLAPYHLRLDEYARAVVVNKLWYSYAEQLLFGDAGVAFHQESNGKYLVVDDSLVLRFKHLDGAYRTRNFPTRRAKAWNSQLHFPNIPPLARLDLGYRLDVTGTVVLDAMVMLTVGKQSVWRWQIWGASISEFAASPKDMLGRLVYAHDDYSGGVP